MTDVKQQQPQPEPENALDPNVKCVRPAPHAKYASFMFSLANHATRGLTGSPRVLHLQI
jgi:hypothetical protein